MSHNIIMAGDINLFGVTDPELPFVHVKEKLHSVDVVFANLECCFYEGDFISLNNYDVFYVPVNAANALTNSGIQVVGIANNANYGTPAILSSIQQLDTLNIMHTGAGNNIEEAARPVVLERSGTRFGFIQRTSVYWPNSHEATENYPGVATIAAHTAYRPRLDRSKTLNRPGVAPEVLTWTDPSALARFQGDIKSLRNQTDILVTSHHWGLSHEILEYQTQIAHAAIDSGADIVFGHGPHFPLGIEVYNGKPVFYGLGSFCFIPKRTKHKDPDSVGLMLNVTEEGKKIVRVAFSFVRLNSDNQTFIRSPDKEPEALNRIKQLSKRFGTVFTVEGDEVVVNID